MRKLPVAVFLMVLFGGFSMVSAATIYYSHFGFATGVSTGAFTGTWKIPQFSSSFYITALNVNMGVSAAAPTAYAQIQCFTASNYTGTCGEMGTRRSEYTNITTASGQDFREFVYATSSPGLLLRSDRYYTLTVSGNNGANIGLNGSASPNICTSGCSGTPYTVIYGTAEDAPIINWGAYYQTYVFSTTSIGIATSSPLWGQYSATATIAAMSGSCAQSENFFGEAICAAFAFLFLPNTAVLDRWSQLPTMIQTKFPFSWVNDVQGSITGLTASTTANSPTVSLNLANLGIGSTTPIGNLLPNFEAFSSTTALSYFPAGLWAAGQLLIGAALWLALGWDIYATVRRRHSHV